MMHWNSIPFGFELTRRRPSTDIVGVQTQASEDGHEGVCPRHHGELRAAKGEGSAREALDGADKEREDRQAVCSQSEKKGRAYP